MRRIWAGLLCAVIALAGPVACGVVSQTEPAYVGYFREADLAESAGGDALRAEPVSVEGGNTVRTAQQLMEALLAGPQDETLQSTIPAGTQLLLLNVEGGQARVDLSSAYANLSGIRLTMADYAIALTLTQLPEIFSVKITVRGQELAYRDKQIFAARDVLLSPRGDVVSTVTVQLYFRSEAGELVPEERVLELYEGDTQVGAVVRALENGPEEDSLSAVMPENFRVRSVWQEEDVCYVNLSSAQLEDLPETDALSAAMLSLQRSLCSLESVQEVRFLVDGEFARSYGPVNIAQPYSEG